MPSQPLDGVRVIDLTRLLPGAYATLLLADLGADIVKIEDPHGGDPSRTLPPVRGGTGAYFEVLNRNKRSVTLDLRSPDTAPVLDAVLARADVVIESFRPQTARRLGVDAETLRARHARLICASVSGFGRTGPMAERAAHDINFEALAGLLADPPKVPGMLIGDIGAALHAAAGILGALFQRERTGTGAAVEVSIQDAALSWLLVPAALRLAGSNDPDAVDLPVDGGNACYNIYRTADGRFVALGALEPKFWTIFCQRIGRPDLVALQYAGGTQQASVLDAVRTLMLTRTQNEWLTSFADVDVCLTPVVGVGDVLADPQLEKRGTVVRHQGRTYVTSPIVMTSSGAARVPVRPAPALGADTETVLAEAGVGADERARLRERGII